jgi:two-component system sensor histidine kinase YcbA
MSSYGRRHFVLASLAGIVVALLAEISINPFGTAFRFSLGPVGLEFFALFFMLPGYLTGAVAGMIVPLVHAIFAWITQPTITLAGALAAVHSYLPETLAYSVLGLQLHLYRVHDRTRSPLQLALFLSASDLMANVCELVIRGEFVPLRGAVMMALVALGRAAVTEGTYYILQEGVRERQWAEERQRYIARLLWAVNLQTEAFFLQKSAHEIEHIMAQAHRLYQRLAGHEDQPLALQVAKDIHEVKKDYQRTLSALYRLVKAPPLAPEMNFSEVVSLVFDANTAYAAELEKLVDLQMGLLTDFRTPRYGRWVSILNNLVSNAIEAIQEVGSVTVIGSRSGDQFILQVMDTGTGIPPEDWELIFSPGYSTKFNPLTGASSSGIGLTHVAGLVKSMNGTIRIARSDASGTEFRIEVPWASLETIEQEES